MPTYTTLSHYDPELADAMRHELARQRQGLEMIASENYTSPAVMEATGSFLTNKYSEGYPGRRYYGGNAWIDVVENLARDPAPQPFRPGRSQCPHSFTSPPHQYAHTF